MTHNLSDIEEMRLFNLKLLHGTVAKYIGPTSRQLVAALKSGGMEITGPTLSDIFCRKKEITEHLARQIERAIGRPDGWLSADHSLWMDASGEDGALIQSVLSLSTESKHLLGEFLRSCKN